MIHLGHDPNGTNDIIFKLIGDFKSENVIDPDTLIDANELTIDIKIKDDIIFEFDNSLITNITLVFSEDKSITNECECPCDADVISECTDFVSSLSDEDDDRDSGPCMIGFSFKIEEQNLTIRSRCIKHYKGLSVSTIINGIFTKIYDGQIAACFKFKEQYLGIFFSDDGADIECDKIDELTKIFSDKGFQIN